MQIQIDRNGERYGPYSIEEVNSYLANGTLLPSDNAWHDGMPDWVPVGQIQGVILPSGETSPPPPSPAAGGSNCPQCQAPVEPSQVICMGCGHRLQGEATASQRSKKTLWISLGAVAVVGLAVGGYFLFSSDQSTDEKMTKASVEKKSTSDKKSPTKKSDSLSEDAKKVVGFWDKVDEPEFEKKDNAGVGDYEFFANGEMEKDPGTVTALPEYRGTWELKNQEIVVTWTEPIPLTRYFKIDNDGFLRLIGQEMDGATTRAPSPDKWRKTK